MSHLNKSGNRQYSINIWKSVCLFVLLLYSNITYSQNIQWISFQWHTENISGKTFKMAAMYVPVTIDSLPHKFVMQFDMGSDATMIYGNSIKPYLHKYDNLKSKLIKWTDGREYYKDLNFKIGNTSSTLRYVLHQKKAGNTISRSALSQEKEVLIGTIGADIIKNKILIIDYPNQRIGITDEITDEWKKGEQQTIRVKYGKIIFPLVINGQVVYVLFDTGSSIFALTTSADNAIPLKESGNIDSLKIYSWGQQYMVYGCNVKSDVKFGALTLPKMPLYYDKSGKNAATSKTLDIWGIAGNQYFVHNIVVIDMKNNTMTIK